jgi:hypothetical protein
MELLIASFDDVDDVAAYLESNPGLRVTGR